MDARTIADRAWDTGYREWAPPPALRASVACLWTRVVAPAGDPVTLVLPDACTDLIWQRGRGVFVAGPDTGPAPAALPGGAVLAGVRFVPGAGGPALGVPLSALLDQRVDAADLGPEAGTGMRLLPSASLTPPQALRLLVVGVGAIVAGRPADRLVTGAVRLLGQPSARVDEVAGRLGVSERQLLRRCEAAAGYGPATLRRVLRFRRFVSRVDGGKAEPDLARIAADVGYADQAHLSRECVRLAGLPPTALAARRRMASA
jgi:AraC-like DNA-binding protein